MNSEDVKRLIEYLQGRVRLASGDDRVVEFAAPQEGEMIDGGVHPEAVRQVLDAAWYGEMMEEVVETPEFCDPGDSTEVVLRYARDVVGEYIRKRFRL